MTNKAKLKSVIRNAKTTKDITMMLSTKEVEAIEKAMVKSENIELMRKEFINDETIDNFIMEVIYYLDFNINEHTDTLDEIAKASKTVKKFTLKRCITDLRGIKFYDDFTYHMALVNNDRVSFIDLDNQRITELKKSTITFKNGMLTNY